MLNSLAVEVLAWWLLRISRKATEAFQAAGWFRDHGFGHEYLNQWQRYQRLHRSYRRWLPLYTHFREKEKCQ
jgi:hypothetical protein